MKKFAKHFEEKEYKREKEKSEVKSKLTEKIDDKFIRVKTPVVSATTTKVRSDIFQDKKGNSISIERHSNKKYLPNEDIETEGVAKDDVKKEKNSDDVELGSLSVKDCINTSRLEIDSDNKRLPNFNSFRQSLLFIALGFGIACIVISIIEIKSYHHQRQAQNLNSSKNVVPKMSSKLTTAKSISNGIYIEDIFAPSSAPTIALTDFSQDNASSMIPTSFLGEGQISYPSNETSLFPSDEPSINPSKNTDEPSIHPSKTPTNAPSSKKIKALSKLSHVLSSRVYSKENHDALHEPQTLEGRAYDLMAEQKDIAIILRSPIDGAWNEGSTMTVADKIVQRYSMVTTWLSLSSFDDIPPEKDECFWSVAKCDEEGRVAELRLARRRYRSSDGSNRPWNGYIPATMGSLTSLKYLDVAENDIRGPIPEEIYDLTALEYLYLHDNRMTGTLSERIGDLYGLIDLYLGNNRFEGRLPRNLASKKNSSSRPMRYLSLGRNEFSGTLPPNLQLKKLFYLDLSHNQLSGRLPSNSFDKFYRLRHAYLDHNKFSGTVPESLISAGNRRLRSLSVSNNKFRGTFPVPDEWVDGNEVMNTLELQKNDFSGKLDKRICKIFVFEYGEMVRLGADCGICPCGGALCDGCY